MTWRLRKIIECAVLSGQTAPRGNTVAIASAIIRDMSPAILDVRTSRGYSMATALRGPDADCNELAQELKHLATCRLRAWLGLDPYVCKARYSQYTQEDLLRLAGSLEVQDEWRKAQAGWWIHFHTHIRAALEYCDDPEVDIIVQILKLVSRVLFAQDMEEARKCLKELRGLKL